MKFMNQALTCARRAFAHDDVPIGAVIVRDGVVIFEDKISSLKRFKDDAKEVAQGYECGIGLDRFNDIKVGDILEAYIMEEIAR